MNGRAARAARQAAGSPAIDPSKLLQLTVTLRTGRPVMLVVPNDMTAMEALDLVGYVSGGMAEQLTEARANSGSAIVRRPALVVPGH